MPHLPILHHRRADSAEGAHRWHVDLADLPAIEVELPREERERLDLSDEDVHALLPTALERHARDVLRDGEPVDEQVAGWDTPVRLYADHFRG